MFQCSKFKTMGLISLSDSWSFDITVFPATWLLSNLSHCDECLRLSGRLCLRLGCRVVHTCYRYYLCCFSSRGFRKGTWNRPTEVRSATSENEWLVVIIIIVFSIGLLCISYTWHCFLICPRFIYSQWYYFVMLVTIYLNCPVINVGKTTDY
jgi:hypothetical protein